MGIDQRFQRRADVGWVCLIHLGQIKSVTGYAEDHIKNKLLSLGFTRRCRPIQRNSGTMTQLWVARTQGDSTGGVEGGQAGGGENVPMA